MSLLSHLAACEQRHQSIEKEIETELLHPSPATQKLAELKRKKLHLKDQILKLKQVTRPQTAH